MKRLAVAVVCAIMLIAAVSHAQTYAGDQKFLRNVEIGRSLTVNGATSIGSALSIDAISEKTSDAGVTIDGVKLKDGGALAITGGTNTYNITNGTAVIDVASGASVDINDDLTVSAASTINQDVSTTASPEFAGATLTGFSGILQATAGVLSDSADLDDVPDGTTYGRVAATSLSNNEVAKITDAAGDDMTVALGGADRVLTVEADSTVNQDLSSDASPTFAGGDFSDGNITNVGDVSLDSISSDNITGLITMAGAGGANNENLILDFETVADTVGFSSSTGVTKIDLGSLNLGTSGTIDGGALTVTSVNVSEGNITNAGAVSVDSISADGTTVDYNDVNILELVQEDVGATCTLGQIRFDTGGGTKELCYCEAENTWVCAALAAGPTD